MDNNINELQSLHAETIANTPDSQTRYLDDVINWESKAICILGARGVGKTTLMCQALKRLYDPEKEALYFSADNIIIQNTGLLKTAMQFFAQGGKALFIDEIHKYPNWSVEIKNILDTYKSKQIVFSGSSAIELHKSKGDLSRRAVYYHLKGLSFREYLNFKNITNQNAISLETLLNSHTEISEELKEHSPLEHFKKYLARGYFPYFLEGEGEYLSKLHNVIEKVLYEDIATIERLRQSSIVTLRKLLHLVATSKGLTPNIDKLSKSLGLSRVTIYDCLEYLDRAGLTRSLHLDVAGKRQARKPGKILLDNTNLSFAIFGQLKLETDIGTLRESFFANQLSYEHRCNLHPETDFCIDGHFAFEIGSPNKGFKQVKNTDNAYVVSDGIEVGFGRRIPLYLFGLLY